MGFALTFGRLIGNLLDFRPLINSLVALVLTVFSARSALQWTS